MAEGSAQGGRSPRSPDVPASEAPEPEALDAQIQALAAAAAGRSPVHQTPLAQVRDRVRQGNQLCSAGPQPAHVEDVVLAECGVPARRYSVPDAQAVMVYFHGGGWCTGDLDFADEFCRITAVNQSVDVVSVDYRLAPEHPYPAAIDDAWGALVSVDAHDRAGRQLIVAGDSAGGNLAAVCTLRAREHGGPRIDLQVLIYPVTDSRVDPEDSYDSYHQHETAFPIGRDAMAWFWSCYAPNPPDRQSWDAAPMRAPDLMSLPRALVVLAGHDPLHDEGALYATRLAEADVPVTVIDYPTLSHGFLRITEVVDAAAAARDEIAATIADLIGQTP